MMRRLFFLSINLIMLLISNQCEAFFMPADYEKLYPRTLAVCRDKLDEWNGEPTASESLSSSLSGNRSLYSSSSVLMMGKWKPMPSDSSPVVYPSFVSGDHGKFTFPSVSLGREEGKEEPRIKKIGGELYFWTGPPGVSLLGAGVYNNDIGEMCFVGCVKRRVQQHQALAPTTPETRQNGTNVTEAHRYFIPAFEDSDEACIVRGLLTASREEEGRWKIASGSLASLRLPNETGYFTTMSLQVKIVNVMDQVNLNNWDRFIKSTIFAFEAVILVWQIFHSISSASGYFVSMLMILVQIVVVMCFLSIYFIYIPWRVLTLKSYTYLLSGGHHVPLLMLNFVILLNLVFLLVILRKRMVARRLNVVERPQEVLLAVICMVIYAVTGVGIWSTHNFETYVQVVWCWFLLPQVIANAFWDLRLKPLHWVYVVGVSLCRISYIGWNAARPTIYGVDDLNDFPHGWFWGITGTVSIFGTYALLQQHYGGRAFLPQSWFGYKAIPSSKGEANHRENKFGRDEDTILDL